MKKIIQQLTRRFRFSYVTGYRRIWRYPLIRPYLNKAEKVYDRIELYFKTHPTARRWAKIVSPPLAFLLLLMIIVWVDTPGNRELRNIQNQVASEVYSADSVLLGRYFLQDRTEVKFEAIAPAIVNALIATEDVRFYQHSGVDYRSLGRVLIKSVLPLPGFQIRCQQKERY